MLATWELEDDEANEAGSPPAQAGETGGARVQAPRAVGWVKSVFPVTVCGRQMLRLVGGRGEWQGDTSTLVLCARDQAALDAIEGALMAFWRQLSAVLSADGGVAGEVVVGGGCAEVHVGHYFEMRASLVEVSCSGMREGERRKATRSRAFVSEGSHLATHIGPCRGRRDGCAACFARPHAAGVRVQVADLACVCECRWQTSHACAVRDPCLHVHPGIAGLSTRSSQ